MLIYLTAQSTNSKYIKILNYTANLNKSRGIFMRKSGT